MRQIHCRLIRDESDWAARGQIDGGAESGWSRSSRSVLFKKGGFCTLLVWEQSWEDKGWEDKSSEEKSWEDLSWEGKSSENKTWEDKSSEDLVICLLLGISESRRLRAAPCGRGAVTRFGNCKLCAREMA